ncbi:hypothetical protein EK21DRAFT_95386 [Setomelanomma holmii]|uniref:Uncharacterized protein n=1 Tax=Setomelanomma holmii TaxID=210430 RepID=A0A9P4GW81_9PLEO|nr:hypothetical protein EK21DRAFT_95386 [Setomelanomma holmii]
MHDEHPHPLLAQVPLTISPFLSLPTSVPLPYSYKTLPSTLPPSILQSSPQNTSQTTNATAEAPQQQPAYVQSTSGTIATPDTILTSCLALQQHLQKLEAEARQTLRGWEERRQAEDLAEKRRVAPGWLDSGVHIIKPDEEMVDAGTSATGGIEATGGGGGGQAQAQVENIMDDDPQKRQQERAGEQLDRVFGGLKV